MCYAFAEEGACGWDFCGFSEAVWRGLLFVHGWGDLMHCIALKTESSCTLTRGPYHELIACE